MLCKPPICSNLLVLWSTNSRCSCDLSRQLQQTNQSASRAYQIDTPCYALSLCIAGLPDQWLLAIATCTKCPRLMHPQTQFCTVNALTPLPAKPPPGCTRAHCWQLLWCQQVPAMVHLARCLQLLTAHAHLLSCFKAQAHLVLFWSMSTSCLDRSAVMLPVDLW